MSIRRPPNRSGQPRPSSPEREALDLAPDEVLEGDEEWEGGPVDEAPPAESPRAAVATPRKRTNGSAARAEAIPELPAEPVALPAEVAVALPVEEELGLREWLNRRSLFGLSNWQALLVVGFAVILFLTRFFDLGVKAMHHDESMHAKFAWDLFHGQKYQYNPLLHGPFQFYAVATSYWLFGDTEWTARAVPAIFGVALVCTTFLWRRWLSTAGWLFALAIFIFSPSFTYYARMLREDSYTATWTFLAATGLVGYVLHRRRPWYYAFCVGLAFAFCTKESTYLTSLMFGSFMILSLLWELRNVRLQRVLAGLSAGALLFFFWTAVIGNAVGIGQAQLVGKDTLHQMGGAVLGALLGAALGLAYDLWRPVPAAPAALEVVPAAPRPAARRQVAPPALPKLRWPDGVFGGALRTLWDDAEGFWGFGTLWGGVIVFAIIYVLFYTSFFSNPVGLREGLIGSIRYWIEQHGVQRGNQPWFYYLILLSVYETLPFVMAIVATVHYLRRPTWLTMFLIWWAITALAIYSWAGERMPWLVIHIAMPMVLLSARYLGELATDALRSVWEKRIVFGAVAALGIWTLHTGWPVNFQRPDTPKDLLVYTQTAPDVKKVVADIERTSLEQTGDAHGIGIVVQSGTWWPLSWYLRDFKNAEYPSQLTAQATKPIVLIAAEDDDKNRQYLQGYSRTRYKMRWWYPEDYRNIPKDIHESGGLLRFLGRSDVRDSLWKWLIYRDTTQPLGSYDFFVYTKDGLGAGTSAGAATSAPAQAPGQAGQAAAGAKVDQSVYAAKTVPVAPVAQWGSAGKGTGQLEAPRGVALDSQGDVYVADTDNNRIQKFDRSGKLLTAWGTEGSGNGQFKQPMGVTIDAQGNVLVADTWNHRVQKFDSTGKYIMQWQGQGGFWGPRAIALDGQGNVYVMDTGNKRIQKFDGSGKFLTYIGTGGSGPGQLNEPIGMAVSPTGDIYAADTNNHRIQKFDFTGKFIAEWPVAGWQPGARNEPYLALDSEGNLYATDPGNARVFKFSPTGDLLGVAGGFGQAPGQFNLPTGIAAGDNLFVADSGNNRMQVISLLP